MGLSSGCERLAAKHHQETYSVANPLLSKTLAESMETLIESKKRGLPLVKSSKPIGRLDAVKCWGAGRSGTQMSESKPVSGERGLPLDS